MRTIETPLAPLSEAAFAPYGWLLAPSGAPDFQRPGLSNWRLPFSATTPLRLQVMRYERQEMRLSMFERHVDVTEGRSPIGVAPAVLVVAGDPAKDADPAAGSVRAFFLDGETGVMFRPGVWHGLDCFPARAAHVDYLFLSDEATEDEIEAHPGPVDGAHTQIFDFAAEETCFQIVDPQGLLA